MKTKIISVFVAMSMITLVPVVVHGQKDRMQSSIAVYAKALDQLLLDTQHVYVQASDAITGFYLAETGVIFTGTIGLTSMPEMPAVMGRVVMPSGSVNIDLDIDVKELKSDLKELEQELKAAAEELSEFEKIEISESSDLEKLGGLAVLKDLGKLSKLAVLAETGNIKISDDGKIKIIKMGNCFENIRKEDAERLEKIDEHIGEFKKELAATMVDFASALNAMKDDEKVVIALTVRDKQFKDKFGISALIVQSSLKKLIKLADKNPTDPDYLKEFNFNF